MSEIGPISVRSRFFCRMISCPAANGIICSNCRPSATLAPSCTSSETAARMGSSLDMSTCSPFQPSSRGKHQHSANHRSYCPQPGSNFSGVTSPRIGNIAPRGKHESQREVHENHQEENTFTPASGLAYQSSHEQHPDCISNQGPD